MKNFYQSFKTFWADEDGATAIEYGLMAALIGIVMGAGATTLGTSLKDLFEDIAGQLVV
jgi:pilus assembly protein Flp/PilA